MLSLPKHTHCIGHLSLQKHRYLCFEFSVQYILFSPFHFWTLRWLDLMMGLKSYVLMEQINEGLKENQLEKRCDQMEKRMGRKVDVVLKSRVCST